MLEVVLLACALHCHLGAPLLLDRRGPGCCFGTSTGWQGGGRLSAVSPHKRVAAPSWCFGLLSCELKNTLLDTCTSGTNIVTDVFSFCLLCLNNSLDNLYFINFQGIWALVIILYQVPKNQTCKIDVFNLEFICREGFFKYVIAQQLPFGSHAAERFSFHWNNWVLVHYAGQLDASQLELITDSKHCVLLVRNVHKHFTQ